jgi:hypothetical protein
MAVEAPPSRFPLPPSFGAASRTAAEPAVRPSEGPASRFPLPPPRSARPPEPLRAEPTRGEPTSGALSEPVEPAPTEPPPGTYPPAVAFRRATNTLAAHSRVIVDENAAFLAYEGGLLSVAVRTERWLPPVRERLRDVDFTRFFVGFRNVEVVVDGAGRTGREVRAVVDEKRRAEARAAADASAALRRVLATFGGELESVEPIARSGGPTDITEESDE